VEVEVDEEGSPEDGLKEPREDRYGEEDEEEVDRPHDQTPGGHTD